MTSETPWTTPPVPGDEVPVAVLPATTFDPHPSGPLPAAVPVRQRSRPVIALATLAAVFFLAMGAFLTLWLVEQDNHSATEQQLQSVRDDLGLALKQIEQATARASEAESDKKRLATNLEEISPCAEAAGDFMYAESREEADRLLDQMWETC